MTVKEGLPRTKEGLPKEAFAIVGDPDDPETWKLPHHKRNIFRALQGKLDMEKTVDWERIPAAVAALSSRGYRGQRVDASPLKKYSRQPSILPAITGRLISRYPILWQHWYR